MATQVAGVNMEKADSQGGTQTAREVVRNRAVVTEIAEEVAVADEYIRLTEELNVPSVSKLAPAVP